MTSRQRLFRCLHVWEGVGDQGGGGAADQGADDWKQQPVTSATQISLHLSQLDSYRTKSLFTILKLALNTKEIFYWLPY